jgi:hypothetical protein
MLELGAWLYLLLSLPVLLYLVLIPYWLRGLGVGIKLKVLASYVFSMTILVGITFLFIFIYSGCLENCYATHDDETAMVISTLLITIYLVFVYRRCQSYQQGTEDPDC